MEKVLVYSNWANVQLNMVAIKIWEQFNTWWKELVWLLCTRLSLHSTSVLFMISEQNIQLMADYWTIIWSLMLMTLVWINFNQLTIKQWWHYWNRLVNCKTLILNKECKLWSRQPYMEELQAWSVLEANHLNHIKDTPEYVSILIARTGSCLFRIE